MIKERMRPLAICLLGSAVAIAMIALTPIATTGAAVGQQAGPVSFVVVQNGTTSPDLSGAVFNLDQADCATPATTPPTTVTSQASPFILPQVVQASPGATFCLVQTQAATGFYVGGPGGTFTVDNPIPPAGQVVTIQNPIDPTISVTTATGSPGTGGAINETVTVNGNDGETPTINATLFGPVPPVTPGTCAGVSWPTGGGQASNATVSGPGPYVVGGRAALNLAGCYSWSTTVLLSPSNVTATSGPTDPANQILVNPNISPNASVQLAMPGVTVKDVVPVVGEANENATINATLFGPAAVPSSGACRDITLSTWQAAPQQAFSLAITGDGTYTVGSATLSMPGCYGWSNTLVLPPPRRSGGDALTNDPTLPATQTLVIQPTLTTAASASRGSVTDRLTVSGTENQPASVSGQLLGPLPQVGGSCSGLSWTHAPIAGSVGPITVTTASTATTPAIKATAAGCYSWAQQLFVGTSAPGDNLTVTSPAGLPVETLFTRAAPRVVPPTPPTTVPGPVGKPPSVPPTTPIVPVGLPVTPTGTIPPSSPGFVSIDTGSAAPTPENALGIAGGGLLAILGLLFGYTALRRRAS